MKKPKIPINRQKMSKYELEEAMTGFSYEVEENHL